MRKARISQGIAGVMTLVMVLGQVPTSAVAEAINGSEGVTAEQQTQDSAPGDSGAGDSTAITGNAADGGDASTDSAQQQDATNAEDTAENEAVADNAASNNSADNATAQAVPQSNGVAAQAATKSHRYHASLTKGEIRDYLYNNFGRHLTNYKIKLNDKETTVETFWSGSDDEIQLENGTYSVQYWTLWGYKDCGTLTLQRFWSATFSVVGPSEGGAQIDGKDVSEPIKIDEGTAKTFTVKQIEDYDVVSVKNGNTDLTPNEDGSYTIPNNADSNITIAYKAAEQAHVAVTGDEGLVSVTVGGATTDESGNITVSYKNPGDIVTTPQDGYAITGITLTNDADGSAIKLKSPAYSKCVAAVTDVPTLTKDGHYTLKVTTVKAGIKGRDGAEVGILGRSDKKAYKDVVFAAAFDRDGSSPAGLTADDVTITFNAGGSFGDRWQPLDFERGWLDFGQHEFGENGDGSIEQVRIAYAGNDQYPGSTVEVTVKIVDGRYKTEMSINQSVSITYNSDAATMREELYNKLNPSVTYVNDKGEVAAVPGLSADSFEFEGLDLPASAGEHTGVTVKYKGANSEGDQIGYQPCSVSDVTVTVAKASAKVKVSSKSLTYGETVKIADLVSSDPSASETKPITVIAGIDGDGAGYLSIDLSYYSPEIQSLLSKYLKLDQGVSMSGLLDILNNDVTMGALKIALKAAGVENPDQIVDGLKTVLNTLTQYGLGASTIALGGTPSKAGVYVVAAVTASGNYKTSVGMGYLTIAPKTADVKLTWKEELPHKALPYDEAHGFDFSAKAFDGDTDITDAANVHVTYAGVTTAGDAYLSSDAPTEPGTYTETATVIGGNYFAKPISRFFAINRIETEVVLAGDSFTYNATPQGPAATVITSTGLVDTTGTALNRLYSGITKSGTMYLGSEAPTEAGRYVVTVTYPGSALYGSSSATKWFDIAKADAAISVADDTVTYDGSTHGLAATATIAGGAVDVSDQLVMHYGGKDDEPTDAGTYEVVATFPGNDNINPGSAKAELAIAPRRIQVNCGDQTKVSGAVDPVYDAALTDLDEQTSPWKGTKSVEDELAIKLSDSRDADDPEAPGTYDVIAKTENANFQIVDASGEKTEKAGTLTVLPSIAVVDSVNGAAEVSGDALVEGKTATGATVRGAAKGSQLKLSATANTGYKFCGWKVVSGDAAIDDADAENATLTVGSENVEVKAVFEAKPTKPVKVSVKDNEGGTATVDPAEAYPGQTVTVKAAAAEGYSFDHWVVLSGDIALASATDAVTTFAMTGSEVKLQAVFKKNAAPEPSPSDPSKPSGKADNGSGTKTAAGPSKSDTKLAGTGDRAGVFAPIAATGIAIAGIGTALLRRRRQ